jgi:hypothetical protein
MRTLKKATSRCLAQSRLGDSGSPRGLPKITRRERINPAWRTGVACAAE